MKNQKVIVTIAIGEKYVVSWKKYCQPNWQAYAHKYGYDLICLERPLDLSSRANLRSPAWQKCLVLGQGFARSCGSMRSTRFISPAFSCTLAGSWTRCPWSIQGQFRGGIASPDKNDHCSKQDVSFFRLPQLERDSRSVPASATCAPATCAHSRHPRSRFASSSPWR